MKRFLIIMALVLFAGTGAFAQSIGLVEYGSRVFTTGLPSYKGQSIPDKAPLMSLEKRAQVFQTIEKTFGRITSLKEAYGECCGEHHLYVTLESGDELNFEDGILNGYTVKSSLFPVAAKWFKGGLRVGQKPASPLNEDIVVTAGKDAPNVFYFYDKGDLNDCVFYYRLGPDGTITQISASLNDC